MVTFPIPTKEGRTYTSQAMVRPAGSQEPEHYMAIYHHSVSIVKRSAGKSAVAAAAYRAGDKLRDELTGLLHNYNRKSGVDYSMILSPVESGWISDREKLWNKVEATEKRYDARLAREVTLAIPHELSRDNQIALVEQYAKINYVDRGMIADLNLHHLDGDNPHAHVMLTMRELKIDKHGQVEFGNKNRDWDNKAALIEQRQSWERLANKYLADAGYDQIRIDCRTLQEQGVNRIPQVHLGCHAASMRARGIPTRIGDEYDQIEAENNIIKLQLEEIYNDELVIVDLDGQCKKISTKIDYLEAEISQAAEHSARMREKLDKTKPPTSDDLIAMIGGDDRAKRIVQWCSKNLIIPDGQREFKRESNSITTKMSAINIDPLAVAYIFTDTVRQDKLTINCCKTSGEIVSATGVVTGAIVGLIKNVDALAIQDAIISLRKPAAKPEIDKVGISTTSDRVSTLEIGKVEIPIPDRVSTLEIGKVETPIPDRVSAPEIVKIRRQLKLRSK